MTASDKGRTHSLLGSGGGSWDIRAWKEYFLPLCEPEMQILHVPFVANNVAVELWPVRINPETVAAVYAPYFFADRIVLLHEGFLFFCRSGSFRPGCRLAVGLQNNRRGVLAGLPESAGCLAPSLFEQRYYALLRCFGRGRRCRQIAENKGRRGRRIVSPFFAPAADVSVGKRGVRCFHGVSEGF